MKKEIRILILDDMAADAALIRDALRAGGLDFRSKRVETKQGFLDELEHHPPDLILSNYGLPGLTGFAVLALARKKCPRVPLVFVTGATAANVMLDSLRSGATGFVLKRRLATNLPAVVRRALAEAEKRMEPRNARLELASDQWHHSPEAVPLG